MKSWVNNIKLVLEKNKKKATEENIVGPQEIAQEVPHTMLEGSIHRSNSAATLYSTNQDQKG